MQPGPRQRDFAGEGAFVGRPTAREVERQGPWSPVAVDEVRVVVTTGVTTLSPSLRPYDPTFQKEGKRFWDVYEETCYSNDWRVDRLDSVER